MDREVFLKFISEQKRISTKMLLFLHDPQKYSIATHICAALCLFVNLFYFPEYSIYLALDALALCWWHLGEGKNLATLIMEQGSVALKKKKTPHLGEWGYKGDCYSAHGWKFKLIDINHIFLRFLFSSVLFLWKPTEMQIILVLSYSWYSVEYYIWFHFCHMFSILH